MSASHEFLQAAAIYEPKQLIYTLVGGAALGGAIAKAASIVHKSEMGVRMHKGSPQLKEKYRGYSEEQLEELPDQDKAEGIYRIEKPRLLWLVPIIHKVVKINVADRTTPLSLDDKPWKVDSNDDEKVQFVVNPAARWRVSPDGDNPYKALFGVNNEKDDKHPEKVKELDQTVAWICRNGLGKVLRGMSADDLWNHDSDEVTEETRRECSDRLLEYGVELEEIYLTPNVRAPEEILKEGIVKGSNPLVNALVASRLEGGEELDEGKVMPFPHSST